MGRRTRLAAISLVIILAGCTPKVVYVPVSTCPPPVIGDNPVLPISDLPKDADTGTVLKAYAASLELCKGRVDELTNKLEGYLLP